jgi:hypothetical protein
MYDLICFQGMQNSNMGIMQMFLKLEINLHSCLLLKKYYNANDQGSGIPILIIHKRENFIGSYLIRMDMSQYLRHFCKNYRRV